MSILFFIIVFFVSAIILQNPTFLGFFLKIFIFLLCFLTPFWPFVLIGYYLLHRLKSSSVPTHRKDF